MTDTDTGVVVAQTEETPCSCSGGAPCTCGGHEQPRLVYAIGALGVDFVSATRLDSLTQHMADALTLESLEPADPRRLDHLVRYLEMRPYESSSIYHTLNADSGPLYVIQPAGAFAAQGYEFLRQALSDQVHGAVERVSIGGVIVGVTTLISGQSASVVQPALRCMYSWNTAALVEAAEAKAPGKAKDRSRERSAVAEFLERIYYEQNLGVTAQERAVNAAVTNAVHVTGVFRSALEEDMQLDSIVVEPSSVRPPGRDCWDVKLTFFKPRQPLDEPRRVYRLAIDVSDICPVVLGPVRAWSVR